MPTQTLIIVPARSGSKGIPDKNIKWLGDKPLIAWTARAIRKANPRNSLAILSTDSERYADVGQEAGLHVPFVRPAACSDDTASALAVIDHALQWFEAEYRYLPEQLMWLQPTSPFRSSAIIVQALAMMVQQQADGVIGCKEIHRDLTTLFKTRDGFLTALSEQQVQTRRQDVEPLLTPNGAMYLCKTSVLLQKRSFYAERTLPLVMDAIMSLDIDTPTDWAMAEALVAAGLVEQ
ncbi:cytidylyltransferase domain-containing protein [Candidatus Methylobacter oryzae]|uniref:Acylneuraminate cytidylyltransferase family protein n=1 Tax=Candidatus Methylobacter oryzae TaxID=2497749 RepID=A0ABY3C8N9_9GAMM|nr:acylneuraminate cytidylyltransferase family protein [Candidatus Methylobacter oryzae]TRW92994.1 acylneuraminate cytidylyltransferase family protein [Candidatus Methylobacter oryzae]